MKCEIFSSDESIFRHEDFLIFLNRKGRVVLNAAKIKGVLRHRESFGFRRDRIFDGLGKFHEKKLSLIGIGFRAWCYFDKSRNSQVLLIKVGLSKDVLVIVPRSVVILCLRPTLILIKGFSDELVGLIARQIRSIRSPDSYKGKGIRYEGEFVYIKAGKQK